MAKNALWESRDLNKIVQTPTLFKDLAKILIQKFQPTLTDGKFERLVHKLFKRALDPGESEEDRVFVIRILTNRHLAADIKFHKMASQVG